MKKALFIDRDGTVIVEPPVDFQVDTLEKLEFVPGAISALKALRGLDFELVMATNQDGLGTDAFPEADFRLPQEKMLRTLAGEGVEFDDMLIDRTFESDNAPTRKPRTGMFGHYMDGSYDLAASYVVGDRATDMLLARNLGARGILLAPQAEGRRMLRQAGAEEACVLISDSWAEIAEYIRRGERRVVLTRETRETQITVRLDLDGRGFSGSGVSGTGVSGTGVGIYGKNSENGAENERPENGAENECPDGGEQYKNRTMFGAESVTSINRVGTDHELTCNREETDGGLDGNRADTENPKDGNRTVTRSPADGDFRNGDGRNSNGRDGDVINCDHRDGDGRNSDCINCGNKNSESRDDDGRKDDWRNSDGRDSDGRNGDSRNGEGISTGLRFLDHMLAQIAHHGGVALEVEARGDLDIDEHHTIEDVAIVLGEAIDRALGSKAGIGRYGFALPMDDCRALVLLDFGGRIDFEWDAEFRRERVGDVPTEMFRHFFHSLCCAARCNLQISARGGNEHHKAEAIFKAFARALRMAVARSGFGYDIPSSKGVL